MRSSHERQTIARADLVDGQHLVHPWPDGIDDEIEGKLLPRFGPDVPSPSPSAERDHARHLTNVRPFAFGRAHDSLHQGVVVDLGVPVAEASPQILADEWR